jgi:hypothetical protein
MNLRFPYNLAKFLTTQLALSEEGFSSMELVTSLIPSDFLTNILYAFLITSVHASCPAHLILFGLVVLIIDMFGEA